jgi:hypothetical protein
MKNNFTPLYRMTWCRQHRIEWIGEMLEVYGFINREHLRRKFRISTPQASYDLSDFRRLYPDKVEYNPGLKQYNAVGRQPL